MNINSPCGSHVYRKSRAGLVNRIYTRLYFKAKTVDITPIKVLYPKKKGELFLFDKDSIFITPTNDEWNCTTFLPLNYKLNKLTLSCFISFDQTDYLTPEQVPLFY